MVSSKSSKPVLARKIRNRTFCGPANNTRNVSKCSLCCRFAHCGGAGPHGCSEVIRHECFEGFATGHVERRGENGAKVGSYRVPLRGSSAKSRRGRRNFIRAHRTGTLSVFFCWIVTGTCGFNSLAARAFRTVPVPFCWCLWF